MVDLDAIERLAKAATPGPYTVTHDNDTGPNDEGFWEWFAIAPKGFEHITTIAKCEHGQFRDEHDKVKANAEYFGSLDPATVLELVRLARVGRVVIGAWDEFESGTVPGAVCEAAKDLLRESRIEKPATDRSETG